MASMIFLDSMRIGLIGFGVLAAYGGHQLLGPGEWLVRGRGQATAAQGLGLASMAMAGASAVLAICLPMVLGL